MPPLVEDQVDLLRKEIRSILDREGWAVSEETSRECFLFILWSVHIGLMNMRPGLTRSVLFWLHKRKIRALAIAGDRRLFPQYERRLIEALYVVKNVYVERTEQGWAPPLSHRSARMFLNNAAPEARSAPGRLLDDVLLILRRRSSACTATLLAG
ncbi:hypothetical protein CAF53_15335 [Sphingobium sp. LB126]|nr:hypothetical protein CAF53_15335 [Sphingobium sp. LB126]